MAFKKLFYQFTDFLWRNSRLSYFITVFAYCGIALLFPTNFLLHFLLGAWYTIKVNVIFCWNYDNDTKVPPLIMACHSTLGILASKLRLFPCFSAWIYGEEAEGETTKSGNDDAATVLYISFRLDPFSSSQWTFKPSFFSTENVIQPSTIFAGVFVTWNERSQRKISLL